MFAKWGGGARRFPDIAEKVVFFYAFPKALGAERGRYGINTGCCGLVWNQFTSSVHSTGPLRTQAEPTPPSSSSVRIIIFIIFCRNCWISPKVILCILFSDIGSYCVFQQVCNKERNVCILIIPFIDRNTQNSRYWYSIYILHYWE